MINLSEDLFKQFDALCGRLSPENLSCDGECSNAEVNRRHAAIVNAWKELEKQAGRRVTQEEVEEESFKRYNDRYPSIR